MISALPTLADQVRAAAACAAYARSESVRTLVGPAANARAQQANRLRLAVLRCIAACDDLTTRQISERVAADVQTSLGALNHIIYDLRERGWAASSIAPDRKGMRLGTGRVNSWRITNTGRAALQAFEADRAQTTTPATTGEH